MLFEIALNAIADGYHREAVASGSAALERLYEFAFRVIQKKLKTTDEEACNAWRLVRKSSERQLGMFIAAFLAAFREAPEVMAQDARRGISASTTVAFRNRVIHEGLIPTRGEAIDYANEVNRLCAQILRRLKFEAYSEVMAVTYEERERNHADVVWGEGGLTMGLGAAIDPLAFPTETPPSVEERIEYYSRHRTEIRR